MQYLNLTIFRKVKVINMSKCTDNTTIQTTDSGEFTFTFERIDSSKFDELYNKEVYCAEGMKIDDDTPLLLANYFFKRTWMF